MAVPECRSVLALPRLHPISSVPEIGRAPVTWQRLITRALHRPNPYRLVLLM